MCANICLRDEAILESLVAEVEAGVQGRRVQKEDEADSESEDKDA